MDFYAVCSHDNYGLIRWKNDSGGHFHKTNFLGEGRRKPEFRQKPDDFHDCKLHMLSTATTKRSIFQCARFSATLKHRILRYFTDSQRENAAKTITKIRDALPY
jgi:hypothetical protein